MTDLNLTCPRAPRVARPSATLLVLALLWSLVGGSSVALAQGRPGDLVRYQDLGTYSRYRLDHVLSEEIKRFSSTAQSRPYDPAMNGARLYYVQYVTDDPRRKDLSIVVTGLVALPDGAGGPFPVLSYQHSMECSKHRVPSTPEDSLEARAVIAAFTGRGYAVFMPDYVGKGDSEEAHPFFVAASEATASRDMIRAGRTLCARLGVALKPDLFVSGWSQGGHATMALLRLLESEQATASDGSRTADASDGPGKPGASEKSRTGRASDGTGVLRAAAPIAGAYDLCAAWDFWSRRETSPLLPLLTAYLLQAYEREPGLRGLCHQALKPPYDTSVHDIFDRDLPPEELFKNLPARVGDLLREEFVGVGRSGSHPFFDALRRNEVLSWRTRTPLRLYHGEADNVIPAAQAEAALAVQKSLGGDATLVSAGRNAGHVETFLWTLLEARRWFDTFR